MRRRDAHRPRQQRQVASWLKGKIEHRVLRLLARGQAPSAVDIGQALYRALEAARLRGSLEASLALGNIAETRLICLAGDEIRYREGLIARVQDHGRTRDIDVPARLAVPRYENGMPAGGNEYPALVDNSWEALRDLLAKRESDEAASRLVSAAIRKLLNLEARAPGARTPREAAAQLGFDVLLYLAQ